VSATRHDGGVLRGPKYTMAVWLCGPLPLLATWLYMVLEGWREYEWTWLAVLLTCYLHMLSLFASVVVFTHRPVRHCAEGRLLAVYWLLLAAGMWLAFADLDELVVTAGTLCYAACGVAILMAVVFATRIAATFWSPRNA
jgi:hypothetical protein